MDESAKINLPYRTAPTDPSGATAWADRLEQEMAQLHRMEIASPAPAGNPGGYAPMPRQLGPFGGRVHGYTKHAAEIAYKQANRPDFNAVTPGDRVPTDVLTAALSGRDPKRMAQWHGSTQGQQMGGAAGLMESMRTTPMQRAEFNQQYRNRTLLGQQMEQNLTQSRYDLEKDMASDADARRRAEEEAAIQGYIGERRAGVLESQYPGTGTVGTRNPALEAAIDFNRMGQFAAADDVLKMGTGPAGPMGTGSKPTARMQEIEDMQRTYGISRQQATGLADGTTRLSTNPVTGEAMLVDMVTGKGQPVEMPDEVRNEMALIGLAPEEGASEEDINLYEMARTTTGLMPALQSNLQKITGQIDWDVASDQLLQNLQTFQLAQNQVIRALSINPRFPVAEMERIRKEINIEPSALKDATTLQNQIVSVDQYMKQRLQEEQSAAADTMLPREDRRAALSAAKNIASFLRILGVPEQAQGTAATEPADSAEADGIESIANKYLKQPKE